MQGGRESGARRNPGRAPPHVYMSPFTLRRALATAPPYSTVMLKEKSRVSPGAMTVTLRLCSNTSSSLVSVA